ncbi:MAG TPA: hypothetical protein VNA24_28775, partial [Hyalangium sp.]|nr:hypothetical protein [Hyalangium sp.]
MAGPGADTAGLSDAPAGAEPCCEAARARLTSRPRGSVVIGPGGGSGGIATRCVSWSLDAGVPTGGGGGMAERATSGIRGGTALPGG